MSIFPEDYNEKFKYNNKDVEEISLLKEYAIDFETGEISNTEIVTGLDAIVVRVYLIFLIKKSRWFIYPTVGTNIDTLIGEDLEYWYKETENILRDGLIDEIYITDIQDINITQDGYNGVIEFVVISIYGEYKYSHTERIGA
ncbi:MAG: DUF2634 domain-containing protein [Clostridium butyricum]|nr:DUF2634 domain-containing protein [Clostridium butyricum]